MLEAAPCDISVRLEIQPPSVSIGRILEDLRWNQNAPERRIWRVSYGRVSQIRSNNVSESLNVCRSTFEKGPLHPRTNITAGAETCPCQSVRWFVLAVFVPWTMAKMEGGPASKHGCSSATEFA